MLNEGVWQKDDHVLVLLRPAEMIHASTIAQMRYHKAVTDKATSNFNGHSIQSDIDAASAELAVAKALNIYFKGAAPYQVDLGTNIEVRHSADHNNRLIVREKDDTDSVYVFVTGNTPYMYVRGWINGSDAKLDKFYSSPNGKAHAWFVPQSELHKITARNIEFSFEL